MEEMQKAFNKTIIKLQNTSRIAEEQVSLHYHNRSKIYLLSTEQLLTRFYFVCFQDQKQTESIQVLQSQLENVTKLMLNLTATVSELQREVQCCYCPNLLYSFCELKLNMYPVK